MLRRLYLWFIYGRSTVHAMKGDSLPAQWKAVRLSKLDNQAEQTPRVVYAKPDKVKLWAPEERAKWKLRRILKGKAS